MRTIEHKKKKDLSDGNNTYVEHAIGDSDGVGRSDKVRLVTA